MKHFFLSTTPLLVIVLSNWSCESLPPTIDPSQEKTLNRNAYSSSSCGDDVSSIFDINAEDPDLKIIMV